MLYFVLVVKLCIDYKDIAGFGKYLKCISFVRLKKTGKKEKSE